MMVSLISFTAADSHYRRLRRGNDAVRACSFC